MIPNDKSDLTHWQKGTVRTNGVLVLVLDGRLPKLAERFLVVSYYGMGRRSGSDMVCGGYRCGLRFTVGNENRVSTCRNGSKHGYAKNTVLDDEGIFFIWLYELLYLGILFYDLIWEKIIHKAILRERCSVGEHAVRRRLLNSGLSWWHVYGSFVNCIRLNIILKRTNVENVWMKTKA